MRRQGAVPGVSVSGWRPANREQPSHCKPTARHTCEADQGRHGPPSRMMSCAIPLRSPHRGGSPAPPARPSSQPLARQQRPRGSHTPHTQTPCGACSRARCAMLSQECPRICASLGVEVAGDVHIRQRAPLCEGFVQVCLQPANGSQASGEAHWRSHTLVQPHTGAATYWCSHTLAQHCSTHSLSLTPLTYRLHLRCRCAMPSQHSRHPSAEQSNSATFAFACVWLH